ncbi:hypothetical protein NM208_g8559 [Fusarium decemcellulare]|uniref:Uncharacterized protein n=1 Tax=Fusarium decemcellulare TaxID=57161 RepID=A0ACC1S4X3_9HYPO|nr:hypothetical protein NM208_g8559 [Fusarium decemcellulare]
MTSPNRNSSQSAPLLSQDLQPTSASGFQQQGTVDWIAVANGSVGFSVDVLSRLSKSGVEALTIYAARAIFSNVRLGKLGEIRLQQAMKKIDAFPSVSNVLWFGFGVKHIIRSMQESAEGLSCLGLCACLTEEFSTMLAAKIMRELFLLYNPPAEITPALRQWTSLVEASEGLLAPTEFGLVLHGLTKICLRDGLLNLRGCAPPRDIAVVLKGVFDVSTGLLDRLFLTGGPDCAWVAAVAHWLLDLRVEVQDQDGTILYRPGGMLNQPYPDPQIIITYSHGSSDSVQIVRRHYVVPNGRIFLYRLTEHEDDILSHGRVDWATCLVDTFGSPMQKLLGGLAVTTGACLGSAARILLAVMRDERGVLDHSRKRGFRMDAPPTSSSSYGRGFYLLSRRLLPELDQNPILLQTMESTLGGTYLDAAQRYSQSISSLSQLCPCDLCDRDKNQNIEEKDRPLCLILLIETICNLVRIMSVCCMQQGLEIRPSRSGLEKIYWDRRRRALFMEKPGYDPLHEGLLLAWPRLSILGVIRSLFTGRGDAQSERKKDIHNPSAVSSDGLCFYLNTLTDVTADPERGCLVTIVPGRIEWNHFLYDCVQDLVDRFEPEPDDRRYNSVSARGTDQYDDLVDSSSPDLKAELVVDEAATVKRVLRANYRITSPTFPGQYFMVGARQVWYRLNDAFTAATCQGKTCRSLNGFRSILVEGEGLLGPDIDPQELSFLSYVYCLRRTSPSGLRSRKPIFPGLLSRWSDVR